MRCGLAGFRQRRCVSVTSPLPPGFTASAGPPKPPAARQGAVDLVGARRRGLSPTVGGLVLLPPPAGPADLVVAPVVGPSPAPPGHESFFAAVPPPAVRLAPRAEPGVTLDPRLAA